MISSISPQTARDWLSLDEAVLIDVREADEFASGHIEGAISLPLSLIANASDCEFKALNIPSDKKIIFQCVKGMRSEQGLHFIAQKYTPSHELYNLEGGIIAWGDAGLPIV